MKDDHHHNDDLLFWLYKHRNVFAKVGSYGYETSIPYIHYAKTYNAHNSLIADRENEADIKDVYLLDSVDPNVMSGETRRITGIYFR